MSCQCHQVGGPFIAEDPDCPRHGTQAQAREDQIESLRERAQTETDIIVLRRIVSEIADLATEY